MAAPVEEGRKLNLTLLLTEDGIASPDAEPLTLPAEIVWIGEPTPAGTMCGLRFLTVTDNELERLIELLRAISVRPPNRP